MKKIFLIASFALLTLASVAQITTPRFGTTVGRDNTGRVLTYAYAATTYAATLAYTPNAFETTYKIVLTGALTINVTDTKSQVCDVLTVITTGSGGSRVTTFGTNFISAGTLTAASGKQATARFVFDGVNYVEISRFVEP
jgi:hypothetical protein